MKLALIVVLLAGCKTDKCEAVFDKLAPAMEKELGQKPDRAKMVGECKDKLKSDPKMEAALDCMLQISGTPSRADLDKCAVKKKSHMNEAELELDKIGKNAKRVFADTSAFPKGKVGLSPANECCFGNSGVSGGKCPVDAKVWQDPVWQALDFEISEPSTYRYSYDSDGTTFTALAVGDADCDKNLATFTLTGKIDNGNATVDLQKPPPGQY
jgi:hypothetical protein